MITKNTVLILGAGASMPYGFPSGLELTNKAINQLTGCQPADEYARLYHGNAQYLNQLGNRISKSRLYSIDRYLHIQGDKDQEQYLAAKGAIAAALLEYEYNCRSLQVKNIGGTLPQRLDDWYRVLWDHLHRVSFSDYKKLTVLTFNYDRSFTEYLFTSIKALYGLNDTEASKKLQEIVRIIHVHGSLGIHPALADDKTNPDDVVPFGVKLTALNVQIAQKHIKVIHEGGESEYIENGIRKAINSADVVAFLGLSYQEENLIKLYADQNSDDKHIWNNVPVLGGTILGMSDGEIIKVVERFRFLNKDFRSRPLMNCSEYLQNSGILVGNNLQKNPHGYVTTRVSRHN